MRNRLVRKILPIVCLLANGLCADMVLADWNESQGYGSFPPEDIDQQIQDDMDNNRLPKENLPQNNSVSGSNKGDQLNSNQAQNYPGQNYSVQSYPAPSYGNYGRPRNASQRDSSPRGNNGSSFSGPWNNRGSDFSAPWSGNGSKFTIPWSNNRSGFSPWGKPDRH